MAEGLRERVNRIARGFILLDDEVLAARFFGGTDAATGAFRVLLDVVPVRTLTPGVAMAALAPAGEAMAYLQTTMPAVGLVHGGQLFAAKLLLTGGRDGRSTYKLEIDAQLLGTFGRNSEAACTMAATALRAPFHVLSIAAPEPSVVKNQGLNDGMVGSRRAGCLIVLIDINLCL